MQINWKGFWNANGKLFIVDYLQKGQPFNGTYCASLLRQLRENNSSASETPIKGVSLHQDNTHVHMFAIAMAAISNNGSELIEILPDPAPSEFHFQNEKQEGQVALKRSPEFCLKLTYRYL